MVRCWEFFDCQKTECPVHKKGEILCWLISGTYCHGKIQGSFYDKLEDCMNCKVFLLQMDGAGAREAIKRILTTLHSIIAHSEEKERDIRLRNIYLQDRIAKMYAPDLVIGPNKEMAKVYDLITKVAATNSTVLLTGETGTGKGLVAKAIHYHSPRAKHPFVPVNCSILNENLLESELFGHVKGAFTGAIQDKIGIFELADKGTFFFDEIGDIGPHLQGKLLEILQDKCLKKVGGTKRIKVDVRIIAATNHDLKRRIKEGSFREDLFYRLNVFSIHLPPLRERKDDIPILASHFLERFNRLYRKKIKGIDKRTIALLMRYEWPGNVRELENVIERAVVLENKELIQPQNLPFDIQKGTEVKDDGPTPIMSLKEVERQHILKVLEFTAYNKSAAAELLGIDRKSLYRKMRSYGVKSMGQNATN